MPDGRLHYELRAQGPLVVLVGSPMNADSFAPLAGALGIEPTPFPGGHTGFVADPDAFAARLSGLLP